MCPRGCREPQPLHSHSHSPRGCREPQPQSHEKCCLQYSGRGQRLQSQPREQIVEGRRFCCRALCARDICCPSHGQENRQGWGQEERQVALEDPGKGGEMKDMKNFNISPPSHINTSRNITSRRNLWRCFHFWLQLKLQISSWWPGLI